PNPVSAAPGFYLENVYVMAGVPSIMQAMFDHIRHGLKGGDKVYSRAISARTTEGLLAQPLGALQKNYPKVDIGSYPFFRDGKLGVCLVARGTDRATLDAAYEAMRALMLSLTEEVIE